MAAPCALPLAEGVALHPFFLGFRAQVEDLEFLVHAAQVAAAEGSVEPCIGAGGVCSVFGGQWRHCGRRPRQPYPGAAHHAAALPASVHSRCPSTHALQLHPVHCIPPFRHCSFTGVQYAVLISGDSVPSGAG